MIRSLDPRRAAAGLLLLVPLALATACDETETTASSLVLEVHEVADVGLDAPRAVIHDSIADVYLVSNGAGGMLDRDEDGFVTRMSPEGEVLDLEWAATVGPQARMHAPKGMALRGDSVFVADIQCIRILHRESGFAEGQSCMDDVTSLNGIDVGPEGSLFITDSGFDRVDEQIVASETDAIFRLVVAEGRQGSTIALGPELGHPAGIDVGSRGIFVVNQLGQVLRFTPEGDQSTLLTREGEELSGIVSVGFGGFAYASESGSSIHLVDETGALHVLMEDVDAPGHLGYDAQRNRLLVPLQNQDRLLFLDLE